MATAKKASKKSAKKSAAKKPAAKKPAAKKSAKKAPAKKAPAKKAAPKKTGAKRIQRIAPPGEHGDRRGSVDACMNYLRQFADADTAPDRGRKDEWRRSFAIARFHTRPAGEECLEDLGMTPHCRCSQRGCSARGHSVDVGAGS